MRRITEVRVDGRPAVMLHDPVSRQALVSFGGWLKPDGPHCTTVPVPGVPPGTGAFVTRRGWLQPVMPAPPPPGRLSRTITALRQHAWRNAMFTGALMLGPVVWRRSGDHVSRTLMSGWHRFLVGTLKRLEGRRP